jgi:hypothetical protein
MFTVFALAGKGEHQNKKIFLEKSQKGIDKPAGL